MRRIRIAGDPNKSERDGFTLIELIIATAVAALLVAGVYGSVVSTERAAKREGARSRETSIRLSGLEILRAEWRGRLGSKGQALPGGGGTLKLTTTMDGLNPIAPVGRATEVSYSITEEGLVRREGSSSNKEATELLIIKTPVRLEFLGPTGWKSSTALEPRAMKIIMGETEVEVVLR